VEEYLLDSKVGNRDGKESRIRYSECETERSVKCIQMPDPNLPVAPSLPHGPTGVPPFSFFLGPEC
jgi:hypothetical protein